MLPTPLSHWIGFHAGLVLLLAIEFIYARRSKRDQHTKSLVITGLWVIAALAFSLFLLKTLGHTESIQYLAGYAIEESLSIDNLFIFLLLFNFFKIAPERQPKVLFWGVASAIFMRGAFIATGLELLNHFHWVSYVFAGILLFAAFRLLFSEEEDPNEKKAPAWIAWLKKLPVSPRDDRFWVREDGRSMITILSLALIAIELTDVVFALDSIPAVLSITQHPFIAYTSNIMAVMGLRSLYFLLANLFSKLRFLHFGLAGVLGFAGAKMLAARWIAIGPLISLGIIISVLGITTLVSLAYPSKDH